KIKLEILLSILTLVVILCNSLNNGNTCVLQGTGILFVWQMVRLVSQHCKVSFRPRIVLLFYILHFKNNHRYKNDIFYLHNKKYKFTTNIFLIWKKKLKLLDTLDIILPKKVMYMV